MRSLSFLLTYTLAFFCFWAAADAPTADYVVPMSANIMATSDSRHYSLSEKDGKALSVKQTHDITYLAINQDDYVYAHQFYGGTLKIDKASAPGAKPIYQTYNDRMIFYDGSRVCLMKVPLKTGKPTKVSFELTETNPLQFSRIMLVNEHFTLKAEVSVNVPKALRGRFSVIPWHLSSRMSFDSVPDSNGGITYRVTAANLPSFSYEADSPEIGASAPQLLIKGSFDDVDTLYSYMHSFVPDDSLNVNDEVRDLAALLARDTSSAQQLIDATTDWVHRNIRYYAIEHDDNAFAPAPAAAVLARRSGDCKGSANLIKTLLRLNGIDTRLAWVGTKGHFPCSWDVMPVLACGNHMIAAALLNDSIQYLDGTATYAFNGFISPSLRGQQALIEDGDKPLLRVVPTTADDFTHLKASYAIEGDTLKGHITRRFTGYQKVSLSYLLGETAPTRKPLVKQRILCFKRSDARASEVRTEESPDRRELHLFGDVAEPGAVKRLGDRLYVDLDPVRDEMLAVVDTAGRKADYELASPYRASFDYSFRIPEGYEVKSLPEDFDINNDFFGASLAYRISNGYVECHALILQKTPLVPLEHLPARNLAVQQLLQTSKSRITLNKISEI
jgi:transglutaminase-like putative cysteine protease